MDAHADGVRHRIGNGAGGGNHRRFADADDATFRVIDEDHVDLRAIGDAGEFVRIEAGVEEQAGLAVHDPFLVERVADAAHDAAVDLAARGQRIDDQPAIVHRDNLLHRHVSRLGIDLHLRKIHSRRAAAGQALLPFAPRAQRIDAEPLAGIFPSRAASIGHAGLRLQGSERVLAGIPYGRRHGGAGAAASAAAGKGEVRIANLDLDLVRLQPEGFRRHDGHNRPRAGAQILRAAADFHRAIGIDHCLGFGTFAAAPPHAGSATNAGLDHARAASRFLVFRGPAEAFRAFLEFAMTRLVPGLAFIVLQPELDRIDAQLDRQFVHHRFGAEGRRRMPGRAEGAGGSGVQRDARVLFADVGKFIEIGRRNIRAAAATRALAAAATRALAAAADAGRAMVFHIGRKEFAVLVRAEFEMLDGGGAIAHSEPFIETREHQLHRRIRRLGKLRGQRTLHTGAELRAKAAAHVIADHLDVRLGQAGGSRESVAHAEDTLSRGPRGAVVALHPDGVAVGFQRVMQLDRRAQFGFANRGGGRHDLVDLRLLLAGDFHRAHVRPVHHLGRIGLHGVVLFHHEGKRLGGDFDGADRVETLLLGLGRDGGQFLPVVAHLPLFTSFQHHGFNARHTLRLGQVDRGDLGGGPFGAQDHAVEAALGLDVEGVFRGAGDLRDGIDARRGLANDLEGTRPACHRK